MFWIFALLYFGWCLVWCCGLLVACYFGCFNWFGVWFVFVFVVILICGSVISLLRGWVGCCLCMVFVVGGCFGWLFGGLVGWYFMCYLFCWFWRFASWFDFVLPRWVCLVDLFKLCFAVYVFVSLF